MKAGGEPFMDDASGWKPSSRQEMSDLKGFHSLAPIYFMGAVLVFMAGGLAIFYDHPIIGAIIMVPGVILLLLSAFAFAVVFQLKKMLKADFRIEKKSKQQKQKRRSRDQNKLTSPLHRSW